MDWQPIETAPKDGTMIIVYANNKGSRLVKKAFWFNGSDGWADGWYSTIDSMAGIERLLWYPTEWISFPGEER